MVEQDTIRLLRECDSGIKMGISAIDEVVDHVKGDGLRGILSDSRSESQRLQADLQKVLADYHDDGKEPNPLVQGMSWVKTNFEMMELEEVQTIDWQQHGDKVGEQIYEPV